MARGDFVIFEEATRDIANGLHDFGLNVFKVALLTNATDPTAADGTPQLGDYTEVTGTGYTAGGETLLMTVNEAAGTTTIDSTANPTWAQDAAGFTNAYWGLLYNDTSVGDLAVGYVDLGGPVSAQAGPVTINWNASGILDIAKA